MCLHLCSVSFQGEPGASGPEGLQGLAGLPGARVSIEPESIASSAVTMNLKFVAS